MKPDTLCSHRARIRCAVEYIQDDLDGDLELEALARRSGTSPYHFHRLFRDLVGEPPNAYVRRLRLERAARCLRYGARPIGKVARLAGYETHAAFTRAFRTAFGCAPSEYHRRAERFEPLRKLEVSIERLPKRSIVFVRCVGPYDQAPAAIEQLLVWAILRGLEGTTPAGVYHDEQSITPPAHTRYDAALLVRSDGAARATDRTTGEQDVRVRELPDRDYAVMRVDAPCTTPQLRRMYDHVFRQVLPANGRRALDEGVFEVYPSGPGGSQVHVHVPLA